MPGRWSSAAACRRCCWRRSATGQALFQAACGILHDDGRRAAMAKAMASLGVRDASERIIRTVEEIRPARG